jgi:hypothetical protein
LSFLRICWALSPVVIESWTHCNMWSVDTLHWRLCFEAESMAVPVLAASEA